MKKKTMQLIKSERPFKSMVVIYGGTEDKIDAKRQFTCFKWILLGLLLLILFSLLFSSCGCCTTNTMLKSH